MSLLLLFDRLLIFPHLHEEFWEKEMYQGKSGVQIDRMLELLK